MITTRVANSSLRVVAKRASGYSSVSRAGAVVRQDKLEDLFCDNEGTNNNNNNNNNNTHHHQQKKYQSTLTTSNNFTVGNFRDDNNNYDDDDDHKKRYSAYYPTQHTTQMQMQMQMQMQLEPRRMYHATTSAERGPAIIMALASVSALGFAGSSAIKSYKEWKDAQPTKEEMEEMQKQEEKDQAKTNAEDEQQQQKEKGTGEEKARTNVFREWFDVGTKYYEGGFEDTMTRREAALILGVRESSSPARVKDAHRKLLILNHPDTGGSTFLALKLNEAKELLLKGKSQKGKGRNRNNA